MTTPLRWTRLGRAARVASAEMARAVRVVALGEATHGFDPQGERYHVEQQPVVARSAVAGEHVGLDRRHRHQRRPARLEDSPQLAEDAEERQNDYVMLADIFPTGWHATRLAGIKPGDSIVIYGPGPVGLMSTISATIQGADAERSMSARIASSAP